MIKGPYSTSEAQTPYSDVTHYNNFYEFGIDKSDPAKNAQKFRTSPWTVSVEGEVQTKRKFTMDEILKLAPLEERIYRHRCVEGWSIVVPWIGFSFSTIAKLVRADGEGKICRLPDLLRSRSKCRRQNLRASNCRMWKDCGSMKRMHPLTLLTALGCTANLFRTRTARPCAWSSRGNTVSRASSRWSRFASSRKQPPTTWNLTNANEYGFYSNVNPSVDHPRW